jgi:hypothetical protein
VVFCPTLLSLTKISGTKTKYGRLVRNMGRVSIALVLLASGRSTVSRDSLTSGATSSSFFSFPLHFVFFPPICQAPLPCCEFGLPSSDKRTGITGLLIRTDLG